MNDIYQTVVVLVFCCTLWVHCCLKQCLQWMLGTSNRFCCMLILFDRWKPFWQHVVTFFLNGAASLPFFHIDHVYLTLFVCFSFIICGWLQFTRGNIVDMRCGSTQVKCFAALTWPWRSFQPYDVAQPQIMSVTVSLMVNHMVWSALHGIFSVLQLQQQEQQGSLPLYNGLPSVTPQHLVKSQTLTVLSPFILWSHMMPNARCWPLTLVTKMHLLSCRQPFSPPSPPSLVSAETVWAQLRK